MKVNTGPSGSRRGSALIIVLSLFGVMVGIMWAVMVLHAMRNRSEFASAQRLARMYAVEAGLERARLEELTDNEWLFKNLGLSQAVFSDGTDSFMVGPYEVTVSLAEEDGEWYLITSTARGPDGMLAVAMTGKGSTSFADYARFVSKGNLEIGAYASYGGKVHANGNIGVQGEYVTFYEDVTCCGKITYSGPGKDTVRFFKSATPGVPEIPLPGADQLPALAESAPAGASKYVWDDPEFREKFKTATGSYPASDLKMSVVFKQDKMDVTSTSGAKVMTEVGVDVPNDGTIYCSGPMTVGGNVSRRLSVISPKDIYVDGAVRYTDDSGDGQWVLRDKVTKEPVAFDPVANSWSMMGNWNGPDYEYVMADDWAERMPEVDGAKINPALGIVTAETIYIQGNVDCREIHAALFSSGDVVRPAVGGKKQNLWIHGAIITTGTNPVSSFFSYRTYAYDPNLKDNPPPGFPGGGRPAFCNWHIVASEENL